ncbi:hypothetical protein ACU4GR_05270 [Methylobacterium oryzae CBMB20]
MARRDPRGLDRNRGLRVAEDGLPFTFVYWADLRYPQPLSGDRNREPYRPDHGLGPFPPRRGSPTAPSRPSPTGSIAACRTCRRPPG